MKLKTKLITAAASITLCAAITASVSAYHDMGDEISYYVGADQKKWDNQSSKNAWYLQTDCDAMFRFTVNLGGQATFTLKKWECFSYPIKGRWENKTYGYYNEPIYGLSEDDYYAVVENTGDRSTNGTVRLSKKYY